MSTTGQTPEPLGPFRSRRHAANEGLWAALRERMADWRQAWDSSVVVLAEGERSAPKQEKPGVNLRVVVISAVLAGAFLPGAWLWHRWQLHRNADAMLVRVEQLQSAGRYRDAAEWCYRYLQLRPNDTAAQLRMAEAYDRAAESVAEKRRAADMYRQAVTLDSTQTAARRRMAQLRFEIGDARAAIEQTDHLIKQNPKDPTAWRIKALASYRLGREEMPLSSVETVFRTAVEYNPENVVLAAGLADLVRRHSASGSAEERKVQADAVIDRLVDVNPNSAEARLARYGYRRRFGEPDGDGDLDAALALAPQHLEVLLAAGQRALERAALEEAQGFYRRVIAAAPADRRGYLGFGQTLSAAGSHAEAVKVWQDGLEQVGNSDLFLNLKLAEALTGLGKWNDAGQTLSELERGVVSNPELDSGTRTVLSNAIDVVRGKWYAAQGDYRAAVPLLRRVLVGRQASASTAEDIARLIEVHTLLVECYTMQRQFDLAAGELEAIVRRQPTDPLRRLAAAQARESAGQDQQAADHYEQLARYERPPPQMWVAWARIQLRQLQSTPAEHAAWKDFDFALGQARQAGLATLEAALLSAQADLLRGRGEPALAQLEALAQQHPESFEVLRTRVWALQRRGQPAAADAALDAFEQSAGASEATRLLRSSLALRRRDWAAAEAALGDPGALSPLLIRQRVMVLTQAGRRSDARAAVAELAKQNPGDLAAALLEAELALDDNDLETVQRCEQQLRDQEGAGGGNWRYLRARRLLAQAKSPQDAPFKEAVRLAGEILTARPSWPTAFVLRGMLAEQAGRASEAIEAYRTALDLGEAGRSAFDRLVGLLYRERSLGEVEKLLGRLDGDVAPSPDTAAAAVSVALSRGRAEQAVEIAQRTVREQPSDPMAHIWLAQALLAAQRLDEAEAAYTAATAAAPADAGAWVARLGYYLTREDSEGARRTLAALNQQESLDEPTRAFLLAQAHQRLGDDANATVHYRRALELSPDAVTVQRAAAAFFGSRNRDLAETALRRVLELAPEDAASRRELATLLAAHGDNVRWQEAWRLATQGEAENRQPTADDLRLQAKLLQGRGAEDSRRQALRRMETLAQSPQQLTADDRLLLSALYEGLGQFNQSREQFRELVTVRNPDPAHLAAYADLLLRHSRPAPAEAALDRLDALEPDNPRTAALRARWLKAVGRTADIGPLLESFVQRHLTAQRDRGAQRELLRAVADAYAAVGDNAAARQLRARADAGQ